MFALSGRGKKRLWHQRRGKMICYCIICALLAIAACMATKFDSLERLRIRTKHSQIEDLASIAVDGMRKNNWLSGFHLGSHAGSRDWQKGNPLVVGWHAWRSPARLWQAPKAASTERLLEPDISAVCLNELQKRGIFPEGTTQLDTVRAIAIAGKSSAGNSEWLFEDTPFFTKKYGELLAQSWLCASTDRERADILVDACRIISLLSPARVETPESQLITETFPVEALVKQILTALRSGAFLRARQRALNDDAITRKKRLMRELHSSLNATQIGGVVVDDFGDENEDVDLSELLFYAVGTALEPVLLHAGFSCGAMSLLIVMAFCRTHSGGRLGQELHCATLEIFSGLPPVKIPTKGGDLVERFNFVPGPKAASANTRLLVISFASVGNGLVRHEFARSLRTVAHDCLYVADPHRSWYWQDPLGQWNGFRYHEHRLRSYIERGRYDGVFMLGDSMGGSGALLFSHLATSVLAFVPQVQLEIDPRMRDENHIPSEQIRAFKARMVASVQAALNNGAAFEIHRGSDPLDILNMWQLDADLVDAGGPGITSEDDWEGEENEDSASSPFRVKIHPLEHHFVSTTLKDRGELENFITSRINLHESDREQSKQKSIKTIS